ncbi:MAG: ABC transporter permease, partial [Fulvivirga sp.]|uniref:ABC transporter permease n=1 Tax=Fulvivirga sp. TaxID=1931237 RepID=UPI0032ED944E
MISNYLKVAFRSLKNQKVYSFLNVLGLTIGISSAILIFLFINDELSYDKHHKKAVNIYRLNSGYHLPNSGPFEAYATSKPMVGEAIVKDYPEVVQMCRFNRLTNQMMELPTTQEIIFEEIWAADSNIFSMFTMPLIQGNPRLALDEPYTLVVTRNKARDLFGTEDVLSKTIFFPEDSLEFKITGVMENYPSSSHLKLDIITSIETLKSQNWRPNWWNFNFHTYLELAKNTNAANLENNIQFISRRYIPEQEDGSGYRQEYSLIPLTDIHLNSNLRAEMEANSQLSYIYIFGIIGLFIVLIASINYMNLATASSVKQAKEVGIRKVSGASKADLFSRFMSESLLTTIFSLALSCLVIAITLPELNDLADKSISLSVLLNPLVIFTILCLVFFVGLISGSYPSLYLSAIQPKETLKGSFSSNKKGASLRKFLVIIQFTISIALITGTIIVYNQLDYLRNIRLGFNKEQILVVPIKSNTDEFKLIQNKSKDLSFVL